MEPLLEADEPLRQRALRRARGLALETLILIVLTALAPLLIVCASVVDLVLWLARRRPWGTTVRLLATAWWFVFVELWGLLRLLPIVHSPLHRDAATRRRRAMRLRQRWLIRHFRGVRAIFGLRLHIDGLDQVRGGPLVLLMRHASTVDTLLPDGVVGREHGTKFRYVLKRELLALPTIDIGRRWVPTVFVRRGTGETADAVERCGMLASGLQDDEGLVIYPEGTLFSPERLVRRQRSVAERQPALAPMAMRLRDVLPPQLDGTLALLRAAPTADVVICGHLGLEPFESVRAMWNGALVKADVRLKFWRWAANEVPRDSADETAAWLFARWLELDEWIGATPGRPAEPAPSAAGGVMR